MSSDIGFGVDRTEKGKRLILRVFHPQLKSLVILLSRCRHPRGNQASCERMRAARPLSVVAALAAGDDGLVASDECWLSTTLA